MQDIKSRTKSNDKSKLVQIECDDIPRNKSMPDMQKFKGLSSTPVRNISGMSKINEDEPLGSVLTPNKRNTFDSYSESTQIIDIYRSLDDQDTHSATTPSRARADTASTGPGSPSTIQRQSELDRNDPAHFDRYGFRKQNNYITEEEYNQWWGEYSKYCLKRKKKWETYLSKCGLPLNNDNPLNFPSNCEKLKRYIRKGIPAEWRGNAWWHFARGEEMLQKNKGLYDKLVLKTTKVEKISKKNKNNNDDFDIIERDLWRTFPDNIHFHKEGFQKEEPVMIQSLRRVLVAFTIYDPSIGYCQSMNFIAGLLLLFLDEEKVFWMLVIITKKYLPGVHSLNLEGVNVDQGVLILCIKEYLPELWEQIELSYITSNHQDNLMNPENNKTTIQNYFHKEEYLFKLPPITLTTASWFMSCFIGSVPIETTLRIWDCMFYEKSHFLFKSLLAILKLCEDELLKDSINNSTKKFFLNTISYATQGSTDSISQVNNKRPKEFQMNQDDYDILMFQVIQTFPRKLIDANLLFDKILFKKKFSLNQLTQDEIDLRRKYVSVQRNKLKHFDETILERSFPINSESSPKLNGYSQEYSLSNDLVNETMSSEINGFNVGGLNSINWNNSIKERVRKMRQTNDN